MIRHEKIIPLSPPRSKPPAFWELVLVFIFAVLATFLFV
jgi:hypothetical protein